MSPTNHQDLELLSSLRRQNEDLRQKNENLEQIRTKQEDKIQNLEQDLGESHQVKEMLKNKLKDCKSRLEKTIDKCERQHEKLSQSERENERLKKARDLQEGSQVTQHGHHKDVLRLEVKLTEAKESLKKQDALIDQLKAEKAKKHLVTSSLFLIIL